MDQPEDTLKEWHHPLLHKTRRSAVSGVDFTGLDVASIDLVSLADFLC